MEKAPEFVLQDAHGQAIRLHDFRGQWVVLSFLRGFGWPFCQRHLVQMRESYERVRRAGAVVLAVAPSPAEDVLAAVQDLKLPFPCLPDPDRVVFRQYAVSSSTWSLGQRPAVFLIGPEGQVVKSWKGRQQWEIPSVDEILVALEHMDRDVHG